LRQGATLNPRSACAIASRSRPLVELTINETAYRIAADPDTPLLWAIRDHANLTGTKYGCGIAQCGACTVHVDGEPVRSCQIRVGDVGEGRITTIEGVAGPVAEAVKTAWRRLDVVQCGYCQSGQIMTAVALLTENPRPAENAIAIVMDGQICRCGTYQRIRAAIDEAARSLA
jgi:isoquinoline 1-oxidoreductase alpha subunit